MDANVSKNERTLVIAPHPDDEILGCGGTLLRRKREGHRVGWLIVTGMTEQSGWSPERIHARDAEIARVAAKAGFDEVFDLRLPPARLDELPMGELVAKFSSVFKLFAPTEVLLPHRGDVHSDHRIVFEAGVSCTKWFRYPSVRRVLSYEAPSETEFGLAKESAFVPNYYVDITPFLERKLELMAIYASEIGHSPFPRSVEVLRAQALWRGAAAGFEAAEAFELLRESHECTVS